MAAHAPNAFLIPIISFHEQVAGWQSFLNRRREAASVVRAYEKLGRLLETYAKARIAPFDQAAVERFELLRKQRVRIGTMDLRIASIALVSDYTVLTRNLVDFQQVPGLKVEDWTAGAAEEPR